MSLLSDALAIGTRLLAIHLAHLPTKEEKVNAFFLAHQKAWQQSAFFTANALAVSTTLSIALTPFDLRAIRSQGALYAAVSSRAMATTLSTKELVAFISQG